MMQRKRWSCRIEKVAVHEWKSLNTITSFNLPNQVGLASAVKSSNLEGTESGPGRHQETECWPATCCRTFSLQGTLAIQNSLSPKISWEIITDLVGCRGEINVKRMLEGKSCWVEINVHSISGAIIHSLSKPAVWGKWAVSANQS